MIDAGLCTLNELRDGTYSVQDLLDFHEFLNLKAHFQNELDRKNQKKLKGGLNGKTGN